MWPRSQTIGLISGPCTRRAPRPTARSPGRACGSRVARGARDAVEAAVRPTPRGAVWRRAPRRASRKDVRVSSYARGGCRSAPDAGRSRFASRNGLRASAAADKVAPMEFKLWEWSLVAAGGGPAPDLALPPVVRDAAATRSEPSAAHRTASCNAFETFTILDWLLLAACLAPFILAGSSCAATSSHGRPGEVTMIVGMIAVALIILTGSSTGAGDTATSSSLEIGYYRRACSAR